MEGRDGLVRAGERRGAARMRMDDGADVVARRVGIEVEAPLARRFQAARRGATFAIDRDDVAEFERLVGDAARRDQHAVGCARRDVAAAPRRQATRAHGLRRVDDGLAQRAIRGGRLHRACSG